MCKCCSGSKHASKYKKFEFLNNPGHKANHDHDHGHNHHQTPGSTETPASRGSEEPDRLRQQ